MPAIELQGCIINYELRESGRAKRISIHCDAGGRFEIVYPRGASKVSPREIFESKRDWVLRTLRKIEKAGADSPLPRSYVDGARLPYLGELVQLKLRNDDDKTATARRLDDELVVSLPKALHSDEDVVKRAVMDFYRQQAKDYLPQRTYQLASVHGFSYNRVSIRNQRTRWGSCSVKGNLNFNLRLMMAPPGAIDSVIIHELCHLRVLNHSQDFWNLVYQLCPDYGDWKRWFKHNGHKLAF